MVAKSCGTCEFWKPATNNFSQENRSMGAWGQCKKISFFVPADGTLMLIHINEKNNFTGGDIQLRTRCEFYCAHYETLSKT